MSNVHRLIHGLTQEIRACCARWYIRVPEYHYVIVLHAEGFYWFQVDYACNKTSSAVERLHHWCPLANRSTDNSKDDLVATPSEQLLRRLDLPVLTSLLLRTIDMAGSTRCSWRSCGRPRRTFCQRIYPILAQSILVSQLMVSAAEFERATDSSLLSVNIGRTDASMSSYELGHRRRIQIRRLQLDLAY